MNFNKSFIKKINNIIRLSKEFDNNFKTIININNEQINESNIQEIYNATNNYIFLRSEHGGILILLDKLKNDINSSSTELNDELINKLYNLSTFTSIVNDISQLINNIDFQYKKIALKFPKYINKKPLTLVLFIEKIDKENKYIKMIEELKNKNPENIYKVIECTPDTKIKCKEILGKDINIKIDKLPSLFIINEDNITEISNNHLQNLNSFVDLIN